MASSGLFGDRHPLVGRDRERALLYEQLTAAMHGHGGLLLIGGEAGIGKSSLVEDLIEHARAQSALTLAGGCYDLTTTPPYGPWIEAMREYMPADGQPGLPPCLCPVNPEDVASNQTDRFEEVAQFLSALTVRRPLVLVLEDMHWADEASLDLLRFMARRIGGMHLLAAVTYRDDEVSRNNGLYAMLPVLARESHASRIDMRRLDASAISQLVQARYHLELADQRRLITYLDELGHGNPLYTKELLRTLESEGALRANDERSFLSSLDVVHVPPLLQQVISLRLSQLSETTRDALAMAAVIGQDVPIDVWAEVGGLDDAQLIRVVDEAIAAHVLEERSAGGGLSFTHALAREAMYRSVALPLRRLWHRRTAEVLCGMSSSAPDAVAFHFEQAGDVRAVEWFVRAGLRARRSEAWLNAAQSFGRAAELIKGDHSRAREYGWLRFETGFLQRFSGDQRSIHHLDAAEQAGVEVGDPLLVALAQYGRGAQHSMRGRVRQGLEDIEQGVLAIDGLLESHDVAGTEAHALSVIQSLVDREHVAEPKATGDEHSQPRVNQQRGVFINWLSMSGRYLDAMAIGEPFVDAVVGAFDDRHLSLSQCVTGRRGLGLAYAALARPDEARSEYALARAGYRNLRDYAILGETIWRELATLVIPFETDNLTRREQLVASAADTWSRCLGTTITLDGDRALAELPVAVLEGRWDTALQMANGHLTSPWALLVDEALVTIAGIARHRGDVETAQDCLSKLFPRGFLTEPGDSYFAVTIEGVALAAEIAMDAGDLTSARQWLEAHDRWLAWSGARLWLPANRLAWSRLELLSGNVDLAKELALSALSVASDPRQPLQTANARRQLGFIAFKLGNQGEAEEHLHASVALSGSCAALIERALALVDLAEVRMKSDQIAQARSHLEEAGAICAELGARPMLERIAGLEDRVVAGTREASGIPEGLTPREVEVLRLVAGGMSNREIAEVLFLSPRTVERHIANIYLKIDVHSKAEATNFAVLHGVV